MMRGRYCTPTVGTQAMLTSPRSALPVSRISTSAVPSSFSSRRARGRKSRPIGVSAIERVVRSTSFTPRKASRFCSRRVRPVWEMWIASAARLKPPCSAMATKAWMPSESIFMTCYD